MTERPGKQSFAHWRILPAWFAGCDLKVLRRCPSDVTFYVAVGLGALLLSCLGGVAMTVAMGYVTDTPPHRLVWLGVLWTMVLALDVERLVLQVPTGRRVAIVLMVLMRLGFSVLVAIQLGEPLMLKINEDKIEQRMSEDRRAADRAALTSARAYYTPKIKGAQSALGRIVEQRHELREEIDRERFLSSCSVGQTQCGRSPGCDSYCRLHEGRARRARFRLQSLRTNSVERAERLRSAIADWRTALASEVDRAQMDNARNDGLPERENALHALMKEHPAIRWEVWFWRIFFLALDLTPLVAKVLRNMAVGGDAYERHMAAERDRDTVAAKFIEEEARADDALAKVRADVRIERETDRLWREGNDGIDNNGHDFADGTDPTARPVAARSLSELVDEGRLHEHERVEVPAELRRGALVGLTTMVVVALLLVGLSASPGAVLPVLGLLAVAVALAVYTHGFTAAPRWALRASFATLLTGLSLPVLLGLVAVA